MTKLWQKKLLQKTKNLQLSLHRPLRIAILGIGSELNADDAAGVLIARRLIVDFDILGPDNLLTVDCGTVPENFMIPLCRFMPDWVLIIDAGSLDQLPGTIQCESMQNTDAPGFSTHSLPPSVFSEFLIKETGCVIDMLLIQPVSVDFCEPMSNEMNKAIEEVILFLNTLIRSLVDTA